VADSRVLSCGEMGRGLPRSTATKLFDRKADGVRGYGVRTPPGRCNCSRGDLLVGLDGLHVTCVEEVAGKRGPLLRVDVESPTRIEGCRGCGVVMRSHGRRVVRLIDTPCFGRAVELRWRKRTWHCAEPHCPAGLVAERTTMSPDPALLTTRACWWAIGQLRREHASVHGLARLLGTTWRTVWKAIQPLLEKMAANESRFGGVSALGVDEHVGHHVGTNQIADGGRGPKELTGMVDLSRDGKGRTRAQAARPGPRPVRRRVRRVAAGAQRDLPRRHQGRHAQPVPRLQERAERRARGRHSASSMTAALNGSTAT
jgi:hypothetical protein